MRDVRTKTVEQSRLDPAARVDVTWCSNNWNFSEAK